MNLVDFVQGKTGALRVRDVAPILGVSIQQVYKMAASGEIPTVRIASSVRFDPNEFAAWLKDRYSSLGGRASSSTASSA